MRRDILAGVFAALLFPLASGAQHRAPDLDYGAHRVGFRVIEALDSTRAFRPAVDHRGTRAAETARPVQISLWYPAEPGAAPGGSMRLGDLQVLRETEVQPGRMLTRADTNRLKAASLSVFRGAGRSEEDAEAMWNAPLPVTAGLAPAAGPFPVVVYFTSAGPTNPLLPAYLASHGFVVASFPSNGRMSENSLEYSPNALTLDTDIDDAGFVHMLLQRLPNADTRRLSLVSFSSGSLAALLWQMRDMQSVALVSLEGWERYLLGAQIISASVHYDPSRVRVPMLLLERAGDETSPRFAKVGHVLDSLRFAERTRMSFAGAAHGDFLSHPPAGETSDHHRIFADAARATRLFLQSAAGGSSDARSAFAAMMQTGSTYRVEGRPAIPPVPTEEELYRMAEVDPAEAARAYRDAAARVPPASLFREAVLTRAALLASAPSRAAAIMEIVVSAYPASVSARVTQARFLSDAGRRTEAEEAYRSALDLLPGDPAIVPGDRLRWRERIEAGLERLPPR